MNSGNGKMQRIKTLLSVMEPRNPSFTELNFVFTCVLKKAVPTRAKVQGQPLVIFSNQGAFSNSLIPRTTGDLRLNVFTTICS